MQLSDVEIIKKVIAGEITLFELIIRKYNGSLYKIGRSYSYNHEDTQDLMQETFIDAFSALSKFENRSTFNTWLIKIMLNNCFKKQQKFSFKYEVVDEISENALPLFSDKNANDPNQAMANNELHAVIENALMAVPPLYRMVFTLREINGLNVEETAEILNTTGVNIRVRLNRARKMLRKEIERSYTSQDIFEFNKVFCDRMVESVMNQLGSSR